MKCKYCGGNITLESDVCPYCGKPNEHAQQHAKNMRVYRRVFEKTKSGVQETTSRYTGITVRVVMIAILVIIITLLLVLAGESYSIKRAWIQKKTEKNAPQVIQQMNQYLEEEEFLAFYSFCAENYIETFESPFEAYVPAERVSRSYSYVYQNIMRVVCPPKYMELESVINNLSEDLEYFYDSMDMSNYEYYTNIDWEINGKALAAMEENVQRLLETYCGLTKEETSEIREMSKAKRAVMLEEAILGE